MQIVALYKNGKSRADIRKEHDLGKSTLDSWIKKYKGAGSSIVNSNQIEKENELPQQLHNYKKKINYLNNKLNNYKSRRIL